MNITDGAPSVREITQGIVFGEFDSKKEKLWLMDRPASSFSEKENKENLAYVQGDIDFSFISGERILNNTTKTFVFHLYKRDYEDRKAIKMYFENILFRQRITRLYDDSVPFHYFRGKCSGVSVVDDHVHNRLIVTIDFDCYPYMISELPEGHNEWDKLLVQLDVVQDTEFTVDNEKEVVLINSGSVSVSPKVIANNNFSIQNDEFVLSVTPGETENEEFRLWPGENKLTISGNGTIKFEYYRELI